MNFEISTVEREILDYFYINKISENEALNFIKKFNWFNEPILKNYKEQLYIYKLQKFIEDDDIENVISLLNEKELNIDLSWSVEFAFDNIEIVKLLLEDERVDPSVANNYSFQISSEYEDLDTLKLLLTDNRVNPACSSNFALKTAYRRKNTEMIQVLWKSKKVRNEIFNENIEIYNKINTLYNVDIF